MFTKKMQDKYNQDTRKCPIQLMYKERYIRAGHSNDYGSTIVYTYERVVYKS